TEREVCLACVLAFPVIKRDHTGDDRIDKRAVPSDTRSDLLLQVQHGLRWPNRTRCVASRKHFAKQRTSRTAEANAPEQQKDRHEQQKTPTPKPASGASRHAVEFIGHRLILLVLCFSQRALLLPYSSDAVVPRLNDVQFVRRTYRDACR